MVVDLFAQVSRCLCSSTRPGRGGRGGSSRHTAFQASPRTRAFLTAPGAARAPRGTAGRTGPGSALCGFQERTAHRTSSPRRARSGTRGPRSPRAQAGRARGPDARGCLPGVKRAPGCWGPGPGGQARSASLKKLPMIHSVRMCRERSAGSGFFVSPRGRTGFVIMIFFPYLFYLKLVESKYCMKCP